ncbi:hypothetical protein BGX28_004237 [Mortierella sp. GBA30]|nr:hypothetical protein BGX28_004237 [Mortierella sp. GBA30]
MDFGQKKFQYNLKLTLESGLGALATLGWLKTFSCARAFDKLTKQQVVESVERMLEHWTILETLEAVIEDKASEPAVLELLKKRGVQG